MHDTSAPNPEDNSVHAKTTALFFGQAPENRLTFWREQAEKMPVRAMLLFTLVWLLWTTGYTASVAFQGSTCWPSVCTAPHAAYLVPVFAALLLPRKLWVIVGIIFIGLFILGLANSVHVPFHHAATVNLYLILMGIMTFVIGLAAGCLAKQAGNRYGQRDPRFTPDLVIIGTVFVTTVLVGPVLLLLGDITANLLALPVEVISKLGYNMDLTAHVFHRGTRLAIVGQMMLVALCLPPTRRDKWLFVAIVPIFLLLYWLQISEHMMYPELEVTVLVLVFASLMPPSVTALSVLLGAIPFAFTTGVFTMPPTLPVPGLATTETLSSVLIWILAIHTSVRQIKSDETRRRDQHLRRMEKMQKFADVGRFIIDFKRQEITLDVPAQRIVATPGKVSLIEFLTALRHDSLTRLDLDGPTQFESAVLHLEASDTRPAQDLKVFIWYETLPGQPMYGHGFLLDVTQEQKREAQLRFALKKLEEEGHKQERIFSVISHELRAPVSVMTLLIEKMDRENDWKRSGPAMKQANDQLLETLGNMRLSVDPEQNLPSRKTSVSPVAVLEKIKTLYTQSAELAGIKLSVSCGPEIPEQIVLDETRVQQILGNLVRNAILHSEGSTIQLSVQMPQNNTVLPNQNTMIWSVEDNGVGLTSDEAASLFAPFKRGLGTSVDGSGLGLYIAHSTAGQLGGVLYVAPDQTIGTRFELHLPVEAIKSIR